MAKYIIQGGSKLSGSVKISGNKNEILPCMAATLLTAEAVTLTNVPQIVDVRVMVELLKSLGSTVEEGDHTLTIQTPKIVSTDFPEELTSRLRASILLVGPVLARAKQVRFYHPGGDVIGKRILDAHFDGLTNLGYKVVSNDKQYKISSESSRSNRTEIFLDEASVTATENLLMNAVLRKGTTVIKNATSEPHIVDLCHMLKRMGAQIKGDGSSTIVIEGVNELHGTDFKIGPEHIELGTYAVAAAITKGEIKIWGCSLENLQPITYHLHKMGVIFEENSDGSVTVSGRNLQATPKLHTNIWPGFPTDLMSAAIVLATQCAGVSLLHDWMYESRFFFVDKLIGMGANITIADPHRVLVYGPTPLYARNLETPDIRAGIALVLAALIAKGTSTINRAELIERGYEDVVGTLSNLGAKIQRID